MEPKRIVVETFLLFLYARLHFDLWLRP